MPQGAIPFILAVTLVQVFPSLVVTCTCPSLLPVHNTPLVSGDSAITYKVQWKNFDGATTYLNADSSGGGTTGTSSITVMEIAG